MRSVFLKIAYSIGYEKAFADMGDKFRNILYPGVRELPAKEAEGKPFFTGEMAPGTDYALNEFGLDSIDIQDTSV
jgi:hypothetical protein